MSTKKDDGAAFAAQLKSFKVAGKVGDDGVVAQTLTVTLEGTLSGEAPDQLAAALTRLQAEHLIAVRFEPPPKL